MPTDARCPWCWSPQELVFAYAQSSGQGIAAEAQPNRQKDARAISTNDCCASLRASSEIDCPAGPAAAYRHKIYVNPFVTFFSKIGIDAARQ